ncbi:MAG: hypothetical protein CMP07_01970 [Xanthomonadales bacterium]|nr:hypothetical protein [Xanthomonadales bacterium]
MSGTTRISTGISIALILLLCSTDAISQTATYQQEIELRPGWNAVYVQVEPEDNQLATVFADVPIASVWRWIPTGTGARFIEDPAEGLENIEGWFAWFPEPRPEAFLSNLFRINANTAYLVRVEGNESHRITLDGRPEFVPLGWQTNAFTLTGLPVAPVNPPTFGEFFAASPAHRDQPVYQLDDSGRWQPVNAATTPIRSGEAYWVFTEGNSAFQGAMGVVLDRGESLEFGAVLEEYRVVLRNFTDLPGSFRIRRFAAGGLPLAFEFEDPETGDTSWPNLPESLTLPADAGADVFVQLGVVRRNFSASRMEQVLEITDEFGGRILLHAGANSLQPLAAGTIQAGVQSDRGAASVRMDDPAAAGPRPGLWIGSIEIDGVSEAQFAGTTPEPARQPFTQRVLMHVDAGGQVRLLKDVIQMWQDGTTRPSDDDPAFNETDVPGRFVLITDPSLIGLFSGATVRSGEPVGVRFSTVSYDFPGNSQLMTGAFRGGEAVDVTLVIEPEMPTNPFLHRFHPDHDNKDERFTSFRQEALQVTREMRFEFAVDPPDGTPPPGWGETLIGGVFTEAVSGLHKNPIFASGSFQLRRVTNTPVLNQ